MASLKIALAAALRLGYRPRPRPECAGRLGARDHRDGERRRREPRGKNPGRRGANDPSQSEDALRSGDPGDARRRQAGFVCRRRSDAGRGKRTQGDGGAYLSRGDARDRRGPPPVRPRAGQQHDQRQHHRRASTRRAAPSSPSPTRAASRPLSSIRRRRSSLSSRARRPTSNPARRSSLGGRSRTTARSTPPLSWSARTGSSRRCESALAIARKGGRFARLGRPVLAKLRFTEKTGHHGGVVEFNRDQARIHARRIRYLPLSSSSRPITTTTAIRSNGSAPRCLPTRWLA